MVFRDIKIHIIIIYTAYTHSAIENAYHEKKINQSDIYLPYK